MVRKRDRKRTSRDSYSEFLFNRKILNSKHSNSYFGFNLKGILAKPKHSQAQIITVILIILIVIVGILIVNGGEIK